MIDFTTVTLPLWATSDEATAFFYGFAVMAGVRLFRVGLRWVRRIASDSGGSSDGD